MSDARKSAMLDSSRRQLLGVMGSGAAFVGVSGVRQASASEPVRFVTVSEKIIQQLEHILQRNWAGEVLPVRISRDQLNDTALQHIHDHLQNVLRDETYSEVLQAQIEDEIHAGDLVLAGDWLLSPTERDICGMLLILKRDTPETGML
ncbi:MAG: hypothetical protein ACE37M_12390 [Henriciella sp.]